MSTLLTFHHLVDALEIQVLIQTWITTQRTHSLLAAQLIWYGRSFSEPEKEPRANI